MTLVIGVDGRAKRVRARSEALPGAAGCLRKRLARLRSRTRPDTGTVDVRFEVRFTPGQP